MLVQQTDKERSQRKERDYVGKIPKRKTPSPAPTNPQIGKALLSKKIMIYFAFYDPRNIFGPYKNCHFG